MKILMVCLGNICRSPLAEGILASKLSKDFIVDSAGTASYHEGEPPDPRSIATARQYGLDISNQKSRPITPEDLDEFDMIYAMDNSNKKNILKLATTPEHREKVKLILEEDPQATTLEVPDPYYGGSQGFVKVYEMLDKATDFIVKNLESS